MRLWIVIAVLVGAAGAAIAAYFLQEHETVITRGMLGDEIRRMAELAPVAKDLKK
jgi:hypothetical protein